MRRGAGGEPTSRQGQHGTRPSGVQPVRDVVDLDLEANSMAGTSHASSRLGMLKRLDPSSWERPRCRPGETTPHTVAPHRVEPDSTPYRWCKAPGPETEGEVMTTHRQLGDAAKPRTPHATLSVDL